MQEGQTINYAELGGLTVACVTLCATSFIYHAAFAVQQGLVKGQTASVDWSNPEPQPAD
jgi:hypothetical protein